LQPTADVRNGQLPHGTNKATGVNFPTTTTSTSTPTTPAALSLPGEAERSNRAIKVTLACSPGVGGCAGTITATLEQHTTSKQYVLAADKTATVTFPLFARRGAARLAVNVAPVIGTAPELTTLALKPAG
jgi:hypothetical protein